MVQAVVTQPAPSPETVKTIPTQDTGDLQMTDHQKRIVELKKELQDLEREELEIELEELEIELAPELDKWKKDKSS